MVSIVLICVWRSVVFVCKRVVCLVVMSLTSLIMCYFPRDVQYFF
jgi:hypothetical protein